MIHYGFFIRILRGLYYVFVLNDEIFRPKEIRIAGENVKLIKLKGTLFSFGIVNKDGIKIGQSIKFIIGE